MPLRVPQLQQDSVHQFVFATNTGRRFTLAKTVCAVVKKSFLDIGFRRFLLPYSLLV